jgi:predicted N-acetyltransferase YhbS
MTRGDATREQKWEIRLACEADVPAVEKLIPHSVRELQSAHYSEAQMDAAIGSVFGVDRQLIRDGTYFVVEHEGEIVGCGGWSKRKKLFGSDALGAPEHELLDPKTDPARIRAFFIHPKLARRGIARVILLACEDAMRAEHFTSAEMVATLPGEPFYAAFGYAACERYEVPMANDLTLPVVRMSKHL